MAELSLFLCGDVMLGRGVDQIQRVPSRPRLFESRAKSALLYVRLAEERHGPIPRHVQPDYVWGDALACLAKETPDLRIINLETAVTTSRRPWPKGINYRMHPANIGCLTAAGIDCCVLANNHVLDWGREGVVETLECLRGAGIEVAGAGSNAVAAAAPAILPGSDHGRVLVFGFATASSGVPAAWAAESSSPGVNLLPDLSERRAADLAEAARRFRKPGDRLIASIHWGGNWGHAIDADQRSFAHALIDGGFDLVHGHSSHHPKALELYRQKLILYGCGDFINDYEGIAGYEQFRSDLTLMYFPRLAAETGMLRLLRAVPMQINRFRLQRPPAHDAKWLYHVLAHESGKLGTRLTWHDDGCFEAS